MRQTPKNGVLLSSSPNQIQDISCTLIDDKSIFGQTIFVDLFPPIDHIQIGPKMLFIFRCYQTQSKTHVLHPGVMMGNRFFLDQLRLTSLLGCSVDLDPKMLFSSLLIQPNSRPMSCILNRCRQQICARELFTESISPQVIGRQNTKLLVVVVGSIFCNIGNTEPPNPVNLSSKDFAPITFFRDRSVSDQVTRPTGW